MNAVSHSLLHKMPSYSFKSGIKGFLSPQAYKNQLKVLEYHIKNTNILISHTPYSLKSLYEIAKLTKEQPGSAKLYHHASMAWNIDFFLKGIQNESHSTSEYDKIVNHKKGNKIDAGLLARIRGQWGEFEAFEREFKNSASCCLSSAWTWLLSSKHGQLSIINTYSATSPFNKEPIDKLHEVKNYHTSSIWSSTSLKDESKDADGVFKEDSNESTPILGLNMWEHAFMWDYYTDRKAYVDAFWKVIDWKRVSLMMNE